MSQIKNITASFKAEEFGQTKMNTDELRQWFETKSGIPDDDDTAFIAKSHISISAGKPNPQQFDPRETNIRFLLTSKRLIRNAIDKENIHCDATYKLNYMLVVLGTIDRNIAFHLIGLALTTTETAEDYKFFFEGIKDISFRIYGQHINFKFLVSDCATAIKNGFDAVFANNAVISCFFHLLKNVEKRPFSKSASKQPVLNDLQLNPSQLSFDTAAKFFVKKWKTREKDFISYFEKNWLAKNNTWFEGFAPFQPSTNNATESFNNQIKSNFLYRERPSLNVFKNKIIELVEIYSREYRDDIRSYKSKVTLKKSEWVDALKWAKSPKNVIANEDAALEKTIYFVRAGADDIIADDDVKQYMTGNTFNNYTSSLTSIWKITIPDNEDELDNATCSCPKFFKFYSCKHLLGLKLRLQKVELPGCVNTVENGKTKRGPGRPKKARGALTRM